MAQTRVKTTSITLIGVMTALLCVAGPLAIPLPGMVPITLTTFLIYVFAWLLGWKRSVLCCLLYLLIGAAGLPVFSGFTGGVSRLVGPTGGYLVGYVLMAAVGGAIIEAFPGRRGLHIVGLVVATAVCYAVGTAWLAWQANLTAPKAIAAGVLPFLIGDAIKILAAAWLGPILQKRLRLIGQPTCAN